MDTLKTTPRLLDQLRDKIALSITVSAATYVDWVRRFILFHNKRHPRELGPKEVEAFVTHLAVVGKVSVTKMSARP